MEAAKSTGDEIAEKSDNQDLYGLNQLAQRLSPAELEIHKAELVGACLSIFSVWYADWTCDKIDDNPDDSESFIRDFLLEILDDAERIDPATIHHSERADCYRLLAELPATPEKKLAYLQQSIETYETALEKTGFTEFNAALARTLLDRMPVAGKFDDPAFEEVLRRHRLALADYSEDMFSGFLFTSFRLLEFPFAGNWHWHHRFMDELAVTAARFARHDPYIYLVWASELTRLLDYREDTISPEYAGQLYGKVTELLAFVNAYKTDDTEKLNRLGQCFEKAAKQMTDVANKVAHYETALAYFTKGQSVNPAAWTFPVYGTNVLVAMAKIYQEQRDAGKVIALFETGRELFSNNLYPNDFQLVIYWGDFLIEYARLGYGFQAPGILREAETKLLIAKEQGRQHYSRPYLSLAKVYLKLGDKAKCLGILRECHQVLGQVMDWDRELENGDFEGIVPSEFCGDASEK